MANCNNRDNRNNNNNKNRNKNVEFANENCFNDNCPKGAKDVNKKNRDC